MSDSTAEPTGYEFWEASLANAATARPEALQSGFYRLERGSGVKPVAIWSVGDVLHLSVGESHWSTTDDAQTDAILNWEFERWPDCVAVSEDDYRAAMAEGRWKDEAPVRVARRYRGQAVEPPASAGKSNLPEDPLEAVKAELADLIERAQPVINAGAPKTQADADKASNLSRMFIDLGKRADGLREFEKKPHLEAGRAVDNKWRAPVDMATAWRRKLVSLVDVFLQAERARKEAEKRAAEAEARKLAATAPAEVAQAALSAAQKMDTSVTAGARGMKTKLVDHSVGVITDEAAFCAAILSMPEAGAELRDVLQKFANRLARAKATVPGMTITTEQRAA